MSCSGTLHFSPTIFSLCPFYSFLSHFLSFFFLHFNHCVSPWLVLSHHSHPVFSTHMLHHTLIISLPSTSLLQANFVIGIGDQGANVYCVDFGLSKRYRHPKTLQHIPHRDGRSLTGTPRYARWVIPQCLVSSIMHRVALWVTQYEVHELPVMLGDNYDTTIMHTVYSRC